MAHISKNVLSIKLARTITTASKPHYARVTAGVVYSSGSSRASNVSWSGYVKDDVIYAFAYNKRRGKLVNGKWIPTTWDVVITKIPLDVLAVMPKGTKFEQGRRTWSLTAPK